MAANLVLTWLSTASRFVFLIIRQVVHVDLLLNHPCISPDLGLRKPLSGTYLTW